jgi:hydroxyacylglutathione hydrolase
MTLVFDALALGKLKLAAILVIHHRADHVGGVDEFRNATSATSRQWKNNS